MKRGDAICCDGEVWTIKNICTKNRESITEEILQRNVVLSNRHHRPCTVLLSFAFKSGIFSYYRAKSTRDAHAYFYKRKNVIKAWIIIEKLL